MKKTDVEVGTEYDETAPMAFGREPRSPHQRVRFTSTESAEWVLVVEMVATRWASHDALQWVSDQDSRRIVKLEDVPAGAKNRPGSANDVGEGIRVTTHGTPDRGYLPAERYDANHGVWRPYLAQPAAIHRTWAEHQAGLDARQAKDANYRAESKCEEIQTLLDRVGLGELLRVDQRLGMIEVRNIGHNGPRFLAALQQWADQRVDDPNALA